MLYFSKLKLVLIYYIIIFLSIFSLLNFVENDNNFLLSIKLINEKKDKITIIKYIINNLIFEKYNTKYNYFFVDDLLVKLCIVD